MSAPPRRFVRDDSGQIVVLVAILFLALVFAVALTVNSGLLFVQRRAAQTVADAGALAGAVSLRLDPSKDNAAAAAQTAASLNGYPTGPCVNSGGTYTCTNAATGVTLKVSFPSPGPNASTNAVQVFIAASVGATLTPQWGNTTVQATGVAGGGAAPSQAIMAVGSGNIPKAIEVSNGGELTLYSPTAPTTCNGSTDPLVPGNRVTPPCSLVGGTAQDNSSDCVNNKEAATTSTVVGPTSATLNVVGCAATSGGGSWPAVTHGFLPDPYAGFARPCSGGLAGCATQRTACTATCLPGYYPSSETWGSGTLALCPGVYIFQGSSVNATSGQGGSLSTVAGGTNGCPASPAAAGVLLFFTYDVYPSPVAGNSKCGSLSVKGNGSASALDPQLTGTWAGLLVFGDPGCDGSTASLTTGLTITGNGDFTTRGLVYFPTGAVQLKGNNTQEVSGIVANTISVQNGNVVAIVSTRAAAVSTPTRLTQ